MKKIFIKLIWTLIGFFVTIMFPPLCFSFITWLLFPRLNINFIQLFWITSMIWLCLNYITITIGNTIDRNHKGDDK